MKAPLIGRAHESFSVYSGLEEIIDELMFGRWRSHQPSRSKDLKSPLIDRARKAFAAYRDLEEIIEELMFALIVANREVGRLQAELTKAANQPEGKP